jgi:hypothetical protein
MTNKFNRYQCFGVTMDKDVVKNAIGGIDATLSKAKRALRELIYEKLGGGDGPWRVRKSIRRNGLSLRPALRSPAGYS